MKDIELNDDNKIFLNLIKDKIKPYFSGDSSGHDIDHALRVCRLAKSIAIEEKADLLVVCAASLLHDLFRPKEKEIGKLNYHVSKDALDEIKKILVEINFPKDKINAVLKAIELHEDYSFGVNSEKENSKEGLILQDADNIDAIGAIGIARVFMFSGHYNCPMYNSSKKLNDSLNNPYNPEILCEFSIHHFYDKLLKIKNDMNTETGKKIAKERHVFMENYLKQFFNEWEGKK